LLNDKNRKEGLRGKKIKVDKYKKYQQANQVKNKEKNKFTKKRLNAKSSIHSGGF
jgi:hypothetical protein